ncbi:ankyrin repeat domain-containing protein 37 isoform X1 [Anser cygnoides]|uniref:ankyrin repeat domain-containing protein 37 isoform X1 n=1 Tax=Anser cygnoides TaxID=8845 RepID=UPI0034D37E93
MNLRICQHLQDRRSSGHKLKHRKFWMNMTGHFFTVRVTEHWDRLPREVVESPSLKIFKTRLDAILCKPGSFSGLFEAGTGVNAPADAFGQSPAHLAAWGGEAFFLLWQLQTGADLNQQDCLGEAPIHKAAKAGSLECLALLVAGDAKIDLCNNRGQTAADLALACGFLECAKFLKTIQHTQTMKLRGQSGSSLNGNHGVLSEDLAAQEQEWETSRSTRRKRRSDGV